MNKCWYILLIIIGLAPSFLYSQNLYDLSKVQDVKIYIDDPFWDNKLNAYKKRGEEKRLLAKVKINGVSYDSVGVRYKGNSSYFNTRKTGSTKLPFNVKLNHIKKGQATPDGFKTLKLSNVFRDPSYLREALSYEIAGNYMIAPRANFAKVYVNDSYLGLYNLTESIDNNFLENNFGESNGILIKCDPAWKAKEVKGCAVNEKATLKYLGPDTSCYKNSYELKSAHGWEELVQFTKTLNKDPRQLEKKLNIDATLWMLAFDNVLVNLDSYLGRLSHNYYIYQDSMGQFNPIIWDMNMSFGGFRFAGTGKSLTDTELQELSPLLHYKSRNKERPLVLQLLDNDLYRKIYLAHIRTILNDHFNNDKYKERAQTIQKKIDNLVKEDKNKLYTYEGFPQNMSTTTLAGTSKIIGLTELMEKRIVYLSKHPLLTKTPPTISNVKHQSADDKTTITASIQNADKVLLYYRNTNSIFQKIEMRDNGEYSDGAAEDGIFGISITELPNTQYYIVGENKDAAMLSPEKAAFEFHTVMP